MASTAADCHTASRLINSLKGVLIDLHRHPYPYIPNPEGLKKRASVALIIRINPNYSSWPSTHRARSEPNAHPVDGVSKLEQFFSQDWVQAGEPEVLFIKRASRKGDRWTGHVALPGGGRDPEDADDHATAIRETSEEVGIDLNEEDTIAVGNLPQRLVTTSWGKVPLMVLCPYIFLLTRHDMPPLRLQPTEIASTHWVPIKSLLSPEMRTYEYQDVSNRLAKQEFGIKRWFLRAMLGKMLFSAVRLIPSESLYCTSSAGFGSEYPEGIAAIPEKIRIWSGTRSFGASTDRPLLLWGLTLGVMADLLEFIPPHNALSLWTYPTFSPLDVRLVIWIMSHRFRQQKQRKLNVVHQYAPASIEVGLDSVPTPKDGGRYVEDGEPPEAGISGLGVGQEHENPTRKRRGSRSSRVGFMLDGYYEIVRKGVALALLGRSAFVVALLSILWHRYKRR